MQNLITKVVTSNEGRNEVMKYLYTDGEINKIIRSVLLRYNCPESKIEDIKSEAIISFIKACFRPKFQIKSSTKAYLATICKNIWLSEVTKRSKEKSISDFSFMKESTEHYEEVLVRAEASALFEKLFENLDDKCRKVLTLWSVRKKMKQIAEEMNYKSEMMARKKKHDCLKRLYHFANSRPEIVEELRSLL